MLIAETMFALFGQGVPLNANFGNGPLESTSMSYDLMKCIMIWPLDLKYKDTLDIWHCANASAKIHGCFCTFDLVNLSLSVL